MVSKKILGAAIAAAVMSSQAFAVIDMSAGTGGVGAGAVLYAKESITTSQLTSGLVQVTAAGTELNVRAATGFGVVSTTHAFIRFDLTNAKFKNAVVGGDLTAVTGTITGTPVVAQGGAAGDTFVIFDVTSGGIAQTDLLQLALTGLQVSPTAAATINYAHYSTSPNAVAQTGALATDSYAGVSVANALTTTITATAQVADVNVSPAFTKFVSSGNATSVIGNVKFDLTAGALTAAGVAVTTLAQVIDTAATKSKLEVTGDLSFTGSTTAALTAANLKFNGVNSNTAGTNVPSAKLDTLTGMALAGAGNDVSITATGAINAGSYSLTFTPTGIASAQYGAATTSGALGTITRNGTTVQVPYLTTYSDYNQRLVLVNRGSSAAPYSISFTPEAGVTAAAGTAATGSLAAGKTLVVKAVDVVTLTGGTRTAATVVVTAPSSTIDAATTTVNLSDKSTDTVKLQ